MMHVRMHHNQHSACCAVSTNQAAAADNGATRRSRRTSSNSPHTRFIHAPANGTALGAAANSGESSPPGVPSPRTIGNKMPLSPGIGMTTPVGAGSKVVAADTQVELAILTGTPGRTDENTVPV